jgi:hypothetical protein
MFTNLNPIFAPNANQVRTNKALLAVASPETKAEFKSSLTGGIKKIFQNPNLTTQEKSGQALLIQQQRTRALAETTRYTITNNADGTQTFNYYKGKSSSLTGSGVRTTNADGTAIEYYTDAKTGSTAMIGYDKNFKRDWEMYPNADGTQKIIYYNDDKALTGSGVRTTNADGTVTEYYTDALSKAVYTIVYDKDWNIVSNTPAS